MNAHAPLDPAVDGGFLVQREIVAGPRPQQVEDFLEAAAVLLLQGVLGFDEEEGVPEIGEDFSGQLFRRGHQVGQPAGGGADADNEERKAPLV